MKPILVSELIKFPIFVLMIFCGSFLKLECYSASSFDVTYDDINALNATCAGLDSCKFPRIPNTLEHCNCGSFCSLLGTCCVDSKYRNKYPKPLENIHCEYVYGRNIRRYIPMIKSCDPDLDNDETTEELCNSNGEVSNDPFLKIPVTDPITGISYKNYYCFTCNKHYGIEEPILWNPEIRIKINDTSLQKLCYDEYKRPCVRWISSSSTPNLYYDATRRGWVMKINSSSVPNLHYDTSRRTWVMEKATDVELYASVPKELENVTPVCYDLVAPMISECASDWTDENIEKKCQSYMAVISIKGRYWYYRPRYYRNPHCAICNNENMDDMHCLIEENAYKNAYEENAYEKNALSAPLVVKLFSLPVSNCEENMIYDHFAKKCRRLYRAKKRIYLDHIYI